jgi:DNA-binding NtrC family response regulator
VIAKTRILFVDGDAVFLTCLQYLLRKDRERWDMVFVRDGRPGLYAFRKQPFALVVSDPTVPGIDGAAFLNVITQESPATGVIVLSFHVDRGAILRTVPEVLCKPSKVTDLSRAIERAIDSREVPRDSRDRKRSAE